MALASPLGESGEAADVVVKSAIFGRLLYGRRVTGMWPLLTGKLHPRLGREAHGNPNDQCGGMPNDRGGAEVAAEGLRGPRTRVRAHPV